MTSCAHALLRLVRFALRETGPRERREATHFHLGRPVRVLRLDPLGVQLADFAHLLLGRIRVAGARIAERAREVRRRIDERKLVWRKSLMYLNSGAARSEPFCVVFRDDSSPPRQSPSVWKGTCLLRNKRPNEGELLTSRHGNGRYQVVTNHFGSRFSVSIRGRLYRD